MDTLVTVIVVCVLVLIALLTLGTIFPRLGHALFGWHCCDMSGFDGCSATGTCKYCGKKCLMDSQGNWF